GGEDMDVPHVDGVRFSGHLRAARVVCHQALSLSGMIGMVVGRSVRSDHRYTRIESDSITTARTSSGRSPSASTAAEVRLRVTATGSTPAGSRSTNASHDGGSCRRFGNVTS